MARLKIEKTTLDLWVKIRDCWVLVGPYPPCTQTSAAATGIFEGGVGNPTSSKTAPNGQKHSTPEVLQEPNIASLPKMYLVDILWNHYHVPNNH